MSLADGYTLALQSFAKGLRPEPELWIDEWSEKHAYIPRENGSSYGKYDLERTPCARPILKALSPNHPAKRVVVVAPSQFFKTQIGINWIMASIDAQPANILVLMPNQTLATRLSNRLASTIRDTKKMCDKVAKPRSRDARNTLDTKEFDGGTLYINTAGTAKNLREIPARYLYADEVDGWDEDLDGEGDPIEIAEGRLTTYGARAKIYYTSTPVLESTSKIMALFRRGTQSYFHVPCPHCGHYHQFLQENLRWKVEGNIVKEAWMVCPECGGEIEERQKTEMIKQHKDIATAIGDGETWSFQINAFYMPIGTLSWAELAGQWLNAKEMEGRDSYSQTQTYTNIRLALPYSRGTSDTSARDLQQRSEAYKLRTVPRGGLVLTCAVDVQGDRLEAMVVANGRDGERWVVDYEVITGTPTDKRTWEILDEYLQKPLAHIDGAALKISAALIDTGYSTHDVYGYIRGKKRRKILAIKGANRPNKPIISSRPSLVDVRTNGKTDPRGCELWTIGTDTAKQYLWERWALRTGAGAMHFSNDLPIEFFDGLVSENRVIKYSKGARVVTWEKPNGARNEPLDLSVYNLAAAYYLGLHKKTEADWQELEATILPKPESVLQSVQIESTPNVWDLIK